MENKELGFFDKMADYADKGARIMVPGYNGVRVLQDFYKEKKTGIQEKSKEDITKFQEGLKDKEPFYRGEPWAETDLSKPKDWGPREIANHDVKLYHLSTKLDRVLANFRKEYPWVVESGSEVRLTEERINEYIREHKDNSPKENADFRRRARLLNNIAVEFRKAVEMKNILERQYDEGAELTGRDDSDDQIQNKTPKKSNSNINRVNDDIQGYLDSPTKENIMLLQRKVYAKQSGPEIDGILGPKTQRKVKEYRTLTV